MAQLVVVVDILVTQGDPEHPLPNQRRNQMLDQFGAAMVDEALREAIHQPDYPIRRSQQQPASVRGDRPAIKVTNNAVPSYRCKLKQFCVTLCRHRGAPRIIAKSFSQKNFR